MQTLWIRIRRYVIAGIFIIAAVLASSATIVRQGEAAIITRLGQPIAVHTEPGLYFKWPQPIGKQVVVDRRIHASSSGLYTVQVADGSLLVMECFVTWQVRDESEAIGQYVRSLGGDPAGAAAQLRTVLGSSMQSVSGDFALEHFVNADASQLRLEQFEQRLRASVQEQFGDPYGVAIHSVGCERLMVPENIVAATIDAMIEDRNTLAQLRRSAGLERAGQIVSAAEAESRQRIAQAESDAARIKAEGQKKAAEIYAATYEQDPDLYAFMRRLRTLDQVLGRKSSLILRTDSAPFDLLHDGPQGPVLVGPKHE